MGEYNEISYVPKTEFNRKSSKVGFHPLHPTQLIMYDIHPAGYDIVKVAV